MQKQRNALSYFLWRTLLLNLLSTSLHFTSRLVTDNLISMLKLSLLLCFTHQLPKWKSKTTGFWQMIQSCTMPCSSSITFPLYFHQSFLKSLFVNLSLLVGRTYYLCHFQVTAAIVTIKEKPWERVSVDSQPHEHGEFIYCKFCSVVWCIDAVTLVTYGLFFSFVWHLWRLYFITCLTEIWRSELFCAYKRIYD